MDWLLDTNLVLRFSDKRSASHQKAFDSVYALLNRGELLHLTAQNLIEFWVVATRPEEVNGLGWQCADADAWIDQLHNLFLFVEDSGQVFAEWRKLVWNLSIHGKKAHDARLVAVMAANGIPRLLTFNTQDFQNFRTIKVSHADDVLAGRV